MTQCAHAGKQGLEEFDLAHRHEPAVMTRSQMRILFAGATGVLGLATLPHLDGHEVVGLTRTRTKLEALRALGA